MYVNLLLYPCERPIVTDGVRLSALGLMPKQVYKKNVQLELKLKFNFDFKLHM